MPIYEYKCPCGNVMSEYYPRPTGGLSAIDCKVCGNIAKKSPSWVAHGYKHKGLNFTPIPEGCR